MDLNHVIVAMHGDQVRRVQCRTCKKDHQYRAPKGIDDPKAAQHERTSVARATKEPKRKPIEEEWQQKMLELRTAPSKTYSARAPFSPGEKIQHPSFGTGIVSKLIHPNKIEVLFEHDLKVLIHAPQTH
jgi:hypothetical protein